MSGELVNITLPCYGIHLTVNTDDSVNPGSVISDLSAGKDNCTPTELAAIDMLEFMVLACAREGIDVTSHAFLEAIESSVDRIAAWSQDE